MDSLKPQGLFVKIGPSPACTPAISKVKAMWVSSNMGSGDRDVIRKHVNGMQVGWLDRHLSSISIFRAWW